MRLLMIALGVLLMVPLAAAQTLPVIFQWDASTSPSPTENPIKYRLCTSATAPPYAALPGDRVCADAGAALEQTLQMVVGIKYVFATARNLGVASDGTLDPNYEQESGPSNVLRIEVFAPPGRPDKIRIKSVQQAWGSLNGQTLSRVKKS